MSYTQPVRNPMAMQRRPMTFGAPQPQRGFAPAMGGAGHLGQVDVPAGHQPRDHLGDEPAPPRIGELSGDPGGERG